MLASHRRAITAYPGGSCFQHLKDMKARPVRCPVLIYLSDRAKRLGMLDAASARWGMVPNLTGDRVGHGHVAVGQIGGQGRRCAPPDMCDDRPTALNSNAADFDTGVV